MAFELEHQDGNVRVRTSVRARYALLLLIPLAIVAHALYGLFHEDPVILACDAKTCVIAPDNAAIRRSVAIADIVRVSFRDHGSGNQKGFLVFLETTAGPVQLPEAIPQSQRDEIERWIHDPTGLVLTAPDPHSRMGPLVQFSVGLGLLILLLGGTSAATTLTLDATRSVADVEHRGLVRRRTRSIPYASIVGVRRLPVARGFENVALVLGANDIEEITQGITEAESQQVETSLRAAIPHLLGR